MTHVGAMFHVAYSNTYTKCICRVLADVDCICFIYPLWVGWCAGNLFDGCNTPGLLMVVVCSVLCCCAIADHGDRSPDREVRRYSPWRRHDLHLLQGQGAWGRQVLGEGMLHFKQQRYRAVDFIRWLSSCMQMLRSRALPIDAHV